LDWHRDWYAANGPERFPRQVYQGPGGRWNLTIEEKKRLLLAHIFGVDIDSQAVEVTKLSLLLKVLEGESQDSMERQRRLFHVERALPDLSSNVKCGNSLVGPDFFQGRQLALFDDEEVRRVNAFDWPAEFPAILGPKVPAKRRGFDVVIGNPPYLKEYTDRLPFHDMEGTRLEEYYQGKMDLWYVFACLAIDLLRNGGLHSFIATNNWPSNAGASKLRHKLLKETVLLRYVDFGTYKVFKSAGVNTGIYLLKKATPEGNKQTPTYSRIDQTGVSEEAVAACLEKDQFKVPIGHTFVATVTAGGHSPFRFADATVQRVLDKMQQGKSPHLGENDVAQGMVLPQEFVTSKQLEKIKGHHVRLGEGIFLLSRAEARNIAKTEKEKALVKPFYTSNQLHRYFAAPDNSLWVLYTTRAIEHEPGYGSIKRHLDRLQPIITSSNKPYGIHRARDPWFFEGTKILGLRKTAAPHFTYVDFPCYVTQTFNVIKPRAAVFDLRYLAGVLNSRVAFFWFLKAGKVQGEQLQIDIEPLLRFPLPELELPKLSDKSRHDQMVAVVERMLDLNKRLAGVKGEDERVRFQRLIDATDREIDALVYDLYGLTADEICIVEEATG
jgi:adenine-specific DNA-methyltransferase